MGNSASGARNWFESDWHSFTDFVSGVGATIGETATGITSGNFDYSNAGRDFKNYGTDVKNMMTGAAVSRIGDAIAKTPEQQALENYNRAIDPKASWNQFNYSSGAANTSNSVYGAAVGNNNTKPSDLLKISNPNVKMAIASSRGATRSGINYVGAKFDNSAVSSLTPAPAATASSNTNSAGGTGIATSADNNNTSLETPSTN